MLPEILKAMIPGVDWEWWFDGVPLRFLPAVFPETLAMIPRIAFPLGWATIVFAAAAWTAWRVEKRTGVSVRLW